MIMKSTLIALAALLLWWLTSIVLNQVFAGLSAASAYASIVAWVVVAFGSLLVDRQWTAVPILMIIYVLMFCIVAAVGYDLFYSNIVTVPWTNRILIALLQALIAASPLVFAWGFDAFRERIKRT